MTKDFTIYQNGENISRFGQIDIHNCSNCNFETFILGLYPEIDGIGTGVVGLTDKEQNVLLITRLTGSEYTNFRTELPGKLENRINEIYLKNEFIHFVRKDFKESGLSYQCPLCKEQLNKNKSLSFVEFVDDGGKIWSFENYEKYKTN
jgi:hypothetical protein